VRAVSPLRLRERWAELLPLAIALAAGLAALDKPLHIDDANFVRFARAVLLHPGRPFDAGAVHSNPPGQQYLLAGAMVLLGKSEAALHLSMLPLTLLALLSITKLSIRFGVRPAWLPALLCAVSPAFLLSASSLMPDVAMLGLVLPALVLLFDDEERPHPLRLLGAALLFATSWTLRFSGLPVLVLGALLSLLRGHRRALVPLLALFAAFAFWSWLSAVQLGAPQTLSPLVVAGSPGTAGVLLLRRLLHASSALVLVTAIGPLRVFVLPSQGWRRACELAGALAFAASVVWTGPLLPLAGCALLACAWTRLPEPLPPTPPSLPLPSLPVLASLRSPRGLDTLFLLLWAAAGLAVPVVYNQSAVKYLNLAQPPLLLLLLRLRTEGLPARRLTAVALGCLALSAALLASDVRQARASKALIVEQVHRGKAQTRGRVFFAGTPWGAWIYGLDEGAHMLGGTLAPGSPQADALAPGDVLLDLSWPGQLSLPAEDVELLEEASAGDRYPVRLMGAGAGYWSSDWGVAPFAFGDVPYLRCWRVRVLRRIAGPGPGPVR
jgi:hypothetical protein